MVQRLAIEMYVGPNCSWCEAAKALLARNGLRCTMHDISEPEVLEEFHRRLPRERAIPQVFINGEHIGTYEDLRLRIG